MNIAHLSATDQQFVAFAINHFGSGGHPEAKPGDALGFFERPYVVECVGKAVKSGKVSDEAVAAGQRVLAALMAVNVYLVRDGEYAFEQVCELAECFPGDPQSVEAAARDIAAKGEHRTGGGAAPTFVLSAVGA